MRLTDPDVRYHASYLAAVGELVAAGEETRQLCPSLPAEGAFPGLEVRPETLADPEQFAALVAFWLRQRQPDAPRPRAYVPCTERWMVEDGVFLGRINLRHRLTEALWEWGGHVGYLVRPSARRRGHAGAALLDLLEQCRRHGLREVLVTCDVDNDGSRRVIERAGGQYEDTRVGKLRYWVPVD